MQIIIENCSSPGAHFSKNTNSILLRIDKWINKNNKPTLPFIEFRKRLEHDSKINDNNARNIYPLLKNSGLVEYKPGGILDTASFFTNRGMAYIKALETKDMIVNGDYTQKQKEQALVEIDKLIGSIIYDSLKNLQNNKELNYSISLRWYLLFLNEFQKINKHEFALMVYIMSKGEDNWKDIITPIIKQYRNREIDIDVKVRVRNDIKIKNITGEQNRLEGISFFTAYSFYSGLINQALLVRKVNDYYVINNDINNKIKDLLGE